MRLPHVSEKLVVRRPSRRNTPLTHLLDDYYLPGDLENQIETFKKSNARQNRLSELRGLGAFHFRSPVFHKQRAKIRRSATVDGVVKPCGCATWRATLGEYTISSESSSAPLSLLQ
jgi:hypothetical protein